MVISNINTTPFHFSQFCSMAQFSFFNDRTHSILFRSHTIICYRNFLRFKIDPLIMTLAPFICNPAVNLFLNSSGLTSSQEGNGVNRTTSVPTRLVVALPQGNDERNTPYKLSHEEKHQKLLIILQGAIRIIDDYSGPDPIDEDLVFSACGNENQ